MNKINLYFRTMFHNCNSEEITTGEIVNIRLGNETKPDTGTPFCLLGQTK